MNSALSIRSGSGVLAAVSGRPFSNRAGARRCRCGSDGDPLHCQFPRRHHLRLQHRRRSGVLSAAGGSPIAAGSDPEDITVGPDGASPLRPQTMEATACLPGPSPRAPAAVTALSGSPFPPARTPRGVAVDPAGEVSLRRKQRKQRRLDLHDHLQRRRAHRGTRRSCRCRGIPVGGRGGSDGQVLSNVANNGSGNGVRVHHQPRQWSARRRQAVRLFSRARAPWGVAIDPTGKFSTFPNASSATVSAYAIDGAQRVRSSRRRIAFPSWLQSKGSRRRPDGEVRLCGKLCRQQRVCVRDRREQRRTHGRQRLTFQSRGQARGPCNWRGFRPVMRG